jgi:hypothetical protein
MPATTLRLGK